MTWVSPLSVALPLEYLREIGVVPPPAATVAEGPLEELLAEYRRYLLVERRLSEHTVRRCVCAGRAAVPGRAGGPGRAGAGAAVGG